MGWGRTLLLGDIGNRLDIEDTERDLAALRAALAGQYRRDQGQDQTIESLRRDNEELKLLLATLIRLLTKRGILSDDDVRAFAKSLEP